MELDPFYLRVYLPQQHSGYRIFAFHEVTIQVIYVLTHLFQKHVRLQRLRFRCRVYVVCPQYVLRLEFSFLSNTTGNNVYFHCGYTTIDSVASLWWMDGEGCYGAAKVLNVKHK